MSLPAKKLFRPLAIGGAALIAATSLVACSGDGGSTASDDCVPAHEFETIAPGELTVASYDYYPATLIDGDALTGIEGDLLTEIAERNCLTLTVSSAGGASAVIPSIETGRADVGSGNWLRTNEREEIVNLSLPIWTDVQAVVSLDGITSDELGDGYRVGSVAGNLWNDDMQAWLGDDFVIYQDDEAIYGDLEAGRIDALLASGGSAIGRFDSNPIEGAEVIPVEPNENVASFEQPGQVMWPTSKDNQALTDALDAMIEELRADGTIAAVVEEYGLDPEVAEPGEPFNL